MCTRVLYTGQLNTVITGRSMDWNEDLSSDLWAFPVAYNEPRRAAKPR